MKFPNQNFGNAFVEFLLIFCKNYHFRGGYKVVPKSIEFWQGQTDRIHDRIKFRKGNKDDNPDNILTHTGVDGWLYERLAP